MDKDVAASIFQSFHQYSDAIRAFKNKNKISVVSQSVFTRSHLADAAFSLKEVCESLMSAVISISKNSSSTASNDCDKSAIVDEVTNKVQTSLADMMKVFEKKLLEKIEVVAPTKKSEAKTKVPSKETHVIFVENKDNESDDSTGYTKQQWNDVVANG